MPIGETSLSFERPFRLTRLAYGERRRRGLEEKAKRALKLIADLTPSTEDVGLTSPIKGAVARVLSTEYFAKTPLTLKSMRLLRADLRQVYSLVARACYDVRSVEPVGTALADSGVLGITIHDLCETLWRMRFREPYLNGGLSFLVFTRRRLFARNVISTHIFYREDIRATVTALKITLQVYVNMSLVLAELQRKVLPVRPRDEDRHLGPEYSIARDPEYSIARDPFVLEVIVVGLPRLLSLVPSPEDDGPIILIAVALLGRYTCYRRLCEAEINLNGVDDRAFGSIKTDLLQHWGLMMPALIAITTIAGAVFVAAPGSVIPIDNELAIHFLFVSAITAAFGLIVCAALLLRCWHLDSKQFRRYALGVYDDYCFFAMNAAIPALTLLISCLFVSLFLLAITWGARQRGVITLVAIFGVLVFLQHIVKAGEILYLHTRRGTRTATQRCAHLAEALRAQMGSFFTNVATSLARTVV